MCGRGWVGGDPLLHQNGATGVRVATKDGFGTTAYNGFQTHNGVQTLPSAGACRAAAPT